MFTPENLTRTDLIAEDRRYAEWYSVCLVWFWGRAKPR
jgi:hypothetical protein